MCEFCSNTYHLSNMKWGTGEYGTPGGQVYWSFALTAGNGFGFEAQISNADHQQAIRAAFQAWENVADIDFVEITDSGQTDIRLGWDTIDGPFGVVGEASTSGSRTTSTLFSMTEAEIRFDMAENWTTGSAGANEVGLYQVALHEIGHAIGLNHVSDPNTIMHASNISGLSGLATGDIQGAQLMYGGGNSTTPPPDPDPDPTPDPDPGNNDPGNNDPGTTDPGTGSGGGAPGRDPSPIADPLTPMAATSGSDTFIARGGNEVIDGEGGTDTLEVSGERSEYTLTLSADGIVLTDRAGRDGSDTLVSIERVDFQTGSSSEGSVLPLDQLDGVTLLSDEQFTQIVELYIAYFNRAPDAVGLAFWGNAFAEGLTMEEMAQLFIDQDETRDMYPDDLSNEDFATQVYTNVLGRIPDPDGFDFWVGVLDAGEVSRDTFILSVLEGARADVPQGASPDFVDQMLDDREYLINKTEIGANFAVHKGMSDTEAAAEIMAIFTGTPGSMIDANTAINRRFDDVSGTTDGEFLMPIVGVIDDPMA